MCQTVQGADVWMTRGGGGGDQYFRFQCAKNHHLTEIVSAHIDQFQDRVFNFSCAVAPFPVDLVGCGWSGKLWLVRSVLLVSVEVAS